MFCCMPNPMKDNKPLVVDLDEVLADRAWYMYRRTLGFWQKRVVKRDMFTIDVPENFFDFQEVSQTITPTKKVNFKSSSDQSPEKPSSTGNNNDSLNLLKGKVPSNRELTNPEVLSLDTVFVNSTSQRQLYKFRFEKTRKTIIEVSFQKGFTISGKAKFNLGIPIIGGEVETEMQLQVTNSEGQTFEESMLMEATSDIAVGPSSCYTANIQLEERPLHANFKILSRMSMPQGKAPIVIKRKSDGQKMCVYYVNNLRDVFEKVPFKRDVMGDDGKPIDDQVDFVVEGVVKGMLACSHKIALNSDETEEEKQIAKKKNLNAHSDEI